MGRFICLHTSDEDSKEVWINADAIVAVEDRRPRFGWTRIDTYAGPEGYCVDETVESVMRLIEQKTNSLDNYVCPTPETVNWNLSKEKVK